MAVNKTLAEVTADRLHDMILCERVFLPGDKLPNENDLSATLGVSRATLRETIRILSARGLLEVRRGKGTFVREESPETALDLHSLEQARVRLKDLYEMRLIFEPESIALACKRASDTELAEILRLGRKVEEDFKEGRDWATSDQHFHMALIRASHNDFMIRLFPIINSAVHEVMLLAENKERLGEGAIRDNVLILDFLSRRDERGARGAMSIHMRNIMNSLGLQD